MKIIKVLLYCIVFTCGAVNAQIPNWSATACNDNVQYTMFSELSSGKAVVLVFGNIWCGPSQNINLAPNNLPQIGHSFGFGNPCVSIFNFIEETASGTPTTCDNINYFINTQDSGTFNYPVFSNDGLPLNSIHLDYSSIFNQGNYLFPQVLVFIPNVNNPEFSTLVYNNVSGLGVSDPSNFMNTFATDIMDILTNYNCLNSISENIQQDNDSELEGMYDIMGRQIKLDANQLYIYKYKNGSQRKVFQINF